MPKINLLSDRWHGAIIRYARDAKRSDERTFKIITLGNGHLQLHSHNHDFGVYGDTTSSILRNLEFGMMVLVNPSDAELLPEVLDAVTF